MSFLSSFASVASSFYLCIQSKLFSLFFSYMPHFIDANSVQELWSLLAQNHTHFLLNGDLGMGKTTFVKGIASFLDIPCEDIQSPTYTYLAIYSEKLLHIDMWRIATEADFLSLDLISLIQNYPYVAIERPKRTEHYATPAWLSVVFSPAENWRTIERAPWCKENI